MLTFKNVGGSQTFTVILNYPDYGSMDYKNLQGNLWKVSYFLSS